MRDMPLLSPWISRGLWFLGGYILSLWASNAKDGDEDEDLRIATRRQKTVRRPPPPAEELKLVLVVNDSLKMGKGKIGAQCAHAAVGIYESLNGSQELLLRQWEECGQPKICLKASDDVELRQLEKTALGAGLPAFIVQDAGRTQVAAGSRTVLAIGPAPRSAIDRVTGCLRLL